MKLGRWMCHLSSRFQKVLWISELKQFEFGESVAKQLKPSKFKSWIIILFCLEIGCKWMDQNVSWYSSSSWCSGSSSQGLLKWSTLHVLQRVKFSSCWAIPFQKTFSKESFEGALKQLGLMEYINAPWSTLNADGSTQLMGRHFKEWRKQDKLSHPTIILCHKWMGCFAYNH